MRKYKVLFIAFSVLFFMGCKEEKEKLFIYNWGDYMDMDVVHQFENDEGIQIVYQEFASNEDLYVKIQNSNDQIDLIFPSDYMIERMKKDNLLKKIDLSKIPNYKYIDERFRHLDYDPDDEYSVPYFWGTVGIVYNAEKYPEGLDSWSDLWDEKYKKDIVLYNSQRDVLMVALKKLGYSMNVTDENILEEAKYELLKQKPLVYAYLGDEIKDILVMEDANIGMVYSGDASVIISENEKYKYSIPKEGTNIWFDAIAIPKNSKNIEMAHKFINYLCDPKIAAMNAEYLQYATPETEAKKYLPPEMENDKALFPEISNLKNCEIFSDPSKYLKRYDRIWTEFQSGYNKSQKSE